MSDIADLMQRTLQIGPSASQAARPQDVQHREQSVESSGTSLKYDPNLFFIPFPPPVGWWKNFCAVMCAKTPPEGGGCGIQAFYFLDFRKVEGGPVSTHTRVSDQRDNDATVWHPLIATVNPMGLLKQIGHNSHNVMRTLQLYLKSSFFSVTQFLPCFSKF